MDEPLPGLEHLSEEVEAALEANAERFEALEIEGVEFNPEHPEQFVDALKVKKTELEGIIAGATGPEKATAERRLANLNARIARAESLVTEREQILGAATRAQGGDSRAVERALRQLGRIQSGSDDNQTSRSGEPDRAVTIRDQNGNTVTLHPQSDGSYSMPEFIKDSGNFWTAVNGNLAGFGTAQNMVNAITGAPINSNFGFNYSGQGVNGSFASGPGGGFGGPGGFGEPMVGGHSGGYGFGSFSVGDQSNTGFYIGQQCGETRAKGRYIDGLINYLLAAICQGNLDMIESAVILCGLKAKTTLIETAKHVVRAMQLYDRNMQIVSDKMAELSGKKPQDGGATLAGLNAEMNQYSTTRQAITNTLRDIMTMNEEISTFENSLLNKKDREAQFYRWA